MRPGNLAREAWLQIFYEDGVFLGLGEERCTPSALCDIFQALWALVEEKAVTWDRASPSDAQRGWPVNVSTGIHGPSCRKSPHVLSHQKQAEDASTCRPSHSGDRAGSSVQGCVPTSSRSRVSAEGPRGESRPAWSGAGGGAPALRGVEGCTGRHGVLLCLRKPCAASESLYMNVYSAEWINPLHWAPMCACARLVPPSPPATTNSRGWGTGGLVPP